MDEPLPEIPAALTGSLVEGQSQIDLLNALEEDVPLAPTSLPQEKVEFESGPDALFFSTVVFKRILRPCPGLGNLSKKPESGFRESFDESRVAALHFSSFRT